MRSPGVACCCALGFRLPDSPSIVWNDGTVMAARSFATSWSMDRFLLRSCNLVPNSVYGMTISAELCRGMINGEGW